MTRLAEHEALLAKVDAFVARAEAVQRPWLRCGRGCDACCRTARTAWSVEVEHVARYVGGLAPERRAALEARRADPAVAAGRRCVFLDPDGACAVYAARPIICRTHGPLVTSTATGPMWCELNFPGEAPAQVPALVPADAVLDLEKLDALLALVNRRFLASGGGPERRPLTDALDLPTAGGDENAP